MYLIAFDGTDNPHTSAANNPGTEREFTTSSRVAPIQEKVLYASGLCENVRVPTAGLQEGQFQLSFWGPDV